MPVVEGFPEKCEYGICEWDTRGSAYGAPRPVCSPEGRPKGCLLQRQLELVRRERGPASDG